MKLMIKLIASIILGVIWSLISAGAVGVIGLAGGLTNSNLLAEILVVLLFLPGYLLVLTQNILKLPNLGLLGFLILFFYGGLSVYMIFTIIGKLNNSRFNKRIDLFK